MIFHNFEYLTKHLDNPSTQEHFVDHYLEFFVPRMLKKAREEAGISKKRLAEIVGTTPYFITAYETAGNKVELSLHTLAKIAKALNLGLVVKMESLGDAVSQMRSDGWDKWGLRDEE